MPNVGQAYVAKHGPSMGAQGPLTDETVDQSFTQKPIETKVLSHRHYGHPQEHPSSLRHRKGSADPLHGEEDKLIDEYKDLREKAGRGECNTHELKRVRDIRGRLQEINASREMDARRIIGDVLKEGLEGLGGMAKSDGGGMDLDYPEGGDIPFDEAERPEDETSLDPSEAMVESKVDRGLVQVRSTVNVYAKNASYVQRPLP